MKSRRPHLYCNNCAEVYFDNKDQCYCVFDASNEKYIADADPSWKLKVKVPMWCPLDHERKSRYEMISKC